MTVIRLRERQAASVSPLAFRVTERPMTWTDMQERVRDVTDYKVLLRAHPTTREPVQLAVVGGGYNVIQNKELFGGIDASLPAHVNVDVRDAIAYGGAWCRRDYIFPEIKLKVGDDDIAYRARVINGFGRASISIAVGAITFACDNGIILGQYERIVKKHTAGVDVSNLTPIVMDGIKMFNSMGDTWTQWAGRQMNDTRVKAFLDTMVEKSIIAQRKADLFMTLWEAEKGTRGNTLWAFYNALTFYASHVSEEGPMRLRDSGNDHGHSTLHNREMEVRSIVRSDTWKKLAA